MAIFKKRSKWWIGYRTSDGRWKREPIGPNYALAKEVLNKRLTDVAENKFFPVRSTQKFPFTQLAEKFWNLHGANLRSPSWKSHYKQIVERFGAKKVGSIQSTEIQQFYNDIAARTSASTANRVLTLLKSIWNRAIEWGDCFHNPCATIKKRREPPHRLRFLSEGEIERLLTVAHPRIIPIIICGLLTGMRRGELLNLRWENVDLEQNIIYVLRSKSGRGREIPIAPRLRDIFSGLRARPGELVFAVPDMTLRRYFLAAVAKARLADCRFHTLRHTMASHFIMKTGNLPALQALLGHASPVMTLKYAHLSRGHLVKEMAALDGAMPAPPQLPLAPPPTTPGSSQMVDVGDRDGVN